MKKPPPLRTVFLWALKLYLISAIIIFLLLILAVQEHWPVPQYARFIVHEHISH